ncbi:MAG: hypothetical protein GY708_30405 [Actinomycetia bacterium]|nr:hypothetical protein [Actinomycetes bacterium]
MGETADHWLLKDIHGQIVDQWTKPTPPWANPSGTRASDADSDPDPEIDAA